MVMDQNKLNQHSVSRRYGKGPVYLIIIPMIAIGLLASCRKSTPESQAAIQVVTYSLFEEFVSETGYLTDAEKFGWSFVQKDVYNFIKVEGANWRKPDGISTPGSEDLPVTQVSYNDAMAYCKWSGSKLPSYDEYWELIKEDDREVITNYNGPISAVDRVNVLGNVWEITSTMKGKVIQLAGGSLFCSPTSCHGTSKDRSLFVDKETANIHIGFAVIK